MLPPQTSAAPTPTPTPPTPPTPMIRLDWWYALGCSVALVIYGALSTFCLLSVWPTAAPSAVHSTAGKAGTDLTLTLYKFPDHLTVLWLTLPLTDEAGLMILAFLAGVIGSVVHCLGAVYLYCGKREFNRSWVFFYVLSPFAGGLLAVGLLWVLRGSLVPSGAAAAATSPNGVAGIGFLAGLVSREAIKKLQAVAANMFSTSPPPKANDSSASDSN